MRVKSVKLDKSGWLIRRGDKLVCYLRRGRDIAVPSGTRLIYVVGDIVVHSPYVDEYFAANGIVTLIYDRETITTIVIPPHISVLTFLRTIFPQEFKKTRSKIYMDRTNSLALIDVGEFESHTIELYSFRRQCFDRKCLYASEIHIFGGSINIPRRTYVLIGKQGLVLYIYGKNGRLSTIVARPSLILGQLYQLQIKTRSTKVHREIARELCLSLIHI